MGIQLTDHDGYDLAELKRTSFHGLLGIGGFTLVVTLEFHVNVLRHIQLPTTLPGVIEDLEWSPNLLPKGW